MSLLTRTDLLELKYQALQQIAKREGVKANGKKNVIADLLIQKFPDGVPRYQSSSRAEGVNRKRKSEKQIFSERQRGSPSPEVSDPLKAWVEEVHSAHQSPVVNPLSPAIMPSHSRNPSPAPVPSPTFPHVYCLKGARRIRRELVNLTRETADCHADLQESEDLLQHAIRTTDEMSKEVRGLVCMNHSMQYMYGAMKRDRTIWDGTYLLDSPHQQAWKAYVNEEVRLEDQALEDLNERLYEKQVQKDNNTFGGAQETF
ncbi:hypothetical protein H0H92_010215 [Tricholoma furcatifolium]|nr:hypothetical protein H0H92_010215 [Tricholoma furcatifolium]